MTLYITTYTSNPGQSILYCTNRNFCKIINSDITVTLQRFQHRMITYDSCIIDNHGDIVKKKRYVKVIDKDYKSLLNAGFELNEKFMFQSNLYDRSEIEVSKRLKNTDILDRIDKNLLELKFKRTDLSIPSKKS